MKCALIIPDWTPEQIFPAGTAGSQLNYWQPLGILYVAAALIKAGHEVRFIDGAFLTRDEILDRVTDWKPTFVGIYATTFGWPAAAATAAAIKRLDAGIFICVGGPYPIAAQEQCLQDDDAGIDAVISGEGEETAVELVERLCSGAELDGVRGVIFRQGARIVRNPPRPLIEDLDSLAIPARQLLGEKSRYLPPPAMYRKQPVAVVMTSRGCDRHCLFCYQIDRHREAGVKGVRFRAIDDVLDEVEMCLRQGYREIKFIDDSFTADYDRALEMAHQIKARGLEFPWFASACANQVDKPLLRAMKDAGCWAILIGAESGVQRNLNTLRKGINTDHIRRAVGAAKEVGIKVSTPFLFGIPGETYDDALQSIAFAIDLAPDLASFHALTPFPGTPLYESLDDYGSLVGDLTDFTYQGAVFVPHTMSREEIQALRRLAYKRFYSRPSFLLKRLLAVRTVNDCKVAFGGLRSLLALWTEGRLFQEARRAASLGTP